MQVGKVLNGAVATQIRQQLLTQLRNHVAGTSMRFSAETGFEPSAKIWDAELDVCEKVAQEIAKCFGEHVKLDDFVNKEAWLTATMAVSSALSPNCILFTWCSEHAFTTIDIDTRISPISAATQQTTDVGSFVKQSLYNLAFCNATTKGAESWLPTQLECINLIAQSDLEVPAPAWWEATQKLSDAVRIASAGLIMGDEALELSENLARQFGGIYAHVLERVALRVSDSWDREHGLVMLARFILPLGMDFRYLKQ